MQRKEHVKKGTPSDASKLKIGIVVSQFNTDITERMLVGALDALRSWGVKEGNIKLVRVPGSFEIPLGCLRMIKRRKPHAIVAIGCIVKGETRHDEYLASAVSHGIMKLSLQYNTPISFGVLTTNDLAQANVRSAGNTNKGTEAAVAALEMALL